MTNSIRLQSLAGGLAVSVSPIGASWLSCDVPMADGSQRSVVLRRVEPPDQTTRDAYLGATVGRYANRIAGGQITHGERVWSLHKQPGSPHQLHGGPEGFATRKWTVAEADETTVRFTLTSAEGDQGYPGELRAEMIYRMVDAMTLELTALATTTASTPVCLTNHAYFNLDGCSDDVRRHRLTIASERYLPIDRELIPLGQLATVQDTVFDFRTPMSLQARWNRDEQQRRASGYDHAYLLHPDCAAMTRPAAELTSADGALTLALFSTLPAIQLYSGQFLAGVPRPQGGCYSACAGVALESQFLPDSPNHPEWPQPSCWLQPGEVYQHITRYTFRTRDALTA